MYINNTTDSTNQLLHYRAVGTSSKVDWGGGGFRDAKWFRFNNFYIECIDISRGGKSPGKLLTKYQVNQPILRIFKKSF